MLEVLAIFAAFGLTWFGVGLFRKWSLKKQFLDIPNERSSHETPTPRGAGVVIVIVSVLFYLSLNAFLDEPIAISYIAGVVLIAVVSWLDDLYSVSFVWRFLVHSTAAALVVYELGFWNEIFLPFYGNIELGILGALFTFLWIVWLTNAYNFMDGIDGIAGIQALTAGAGWFLCGKILALNATAVYGGVVAFAALGFLIHNWQPAKVFMGDVGSAFLGYTFACIPLIAQREGTNASSLLPLIAVLAVWLFVFDSIYTFCRRLMAKQKVWTAHREHIYQRMVIGGRSHAFVSVLYGTLSLVSILTISLWLTLGETFLVVLTAVFLLESAALFLMNYRAGKY